MNGSNQSKVLGESCQPGPDDSSQQTNREYKWQDICFDSLSETYDVVKDAMKDKGNIDDTENKGEASFCPSTVDAHKDLLDRLGLTYYFPGKITLQDAQSHSSGKLDTLQDIPWYFLSKILMLDYCGRDNITPTSITSEGNPSSGEEFDFDDMLTQLTDNSPGNITPSMPHPLDVLVVVFWCCSNFFRQYLCEKMFMCKLGIPLILPPVLNRESMLLLWSLRSIYLESRDKDGELHEVPLVEDKIPVISWVRLGEISRSKSKVLNEIINSQSHDTFFHRDCPNGSRSNQRILSEELLETSWYVPSKQFGNSDNLDREVAFINLRGDMKSVNASKITNFLCCVSNILIIFLDIETVKNSEIIHKLKSLVKCNSHVVLIVCKRSNEKFNNEHKNNIKSCFEDLKRTGIHEVSFLFDFDPSGEKNIKVLQKEIIKIINKHLQNGKEKIMKIEDYKVLAKNLEIDVDESIAECIIGKDKAQKIANRLRSGSDNLKEQILPLQCRPWQEWAKLDSESHRCEKKGDDTGRNYINRITIEKRKLRQEQLGLLMDDNSVFSEFSNNFSYPVNQECLYLLEWLKLLLDKLSKNQKLPYLEKCHLVWTEIQSCSNRERCMSLQTELTQLEKTVDGISVGLEHFMREIAQAYEAVHYMGNDASKELKNKTHSLSMAMAELMLYGHSLELMDGDAGHVPIKWVQAVFSHLSKLIGEKKIFVLSVLGIQSSGKSTLLNAMFGLRFPVAAGRCTRGVFVQLVPVCKESSFSDYDYVLVVDTEGLRAIELSKDKLKHDNEIGTFVIGLGDITIINIKGENLSEIEDLLQIVIHAFLKMRLVNKNLDLQPSSIFIHQNVSAFDASQKLKTGQQKLIETLNKVTEAAGKQEGKLEYTQFKQLINFDTDKDIWYISDLWKGDPPMAPPNPGYSNRIGEVKENLLKDKMQNRSFQLNFEKWCTRLKDLWEGILNENFVFSFRNSLEIEAYSSLENELSNSVWLMKKAALEWLNKRKTMIENSGPEVREQDLRKGCSNDLWGKFEEVKEKLGNYFQTNENKPILEQWRENSFYKLKMSYESIILGINSDVEREISKRRFKQSQKKILQTYISTIMEEAKKLAESLTEKLDEKELKNRFDIEWEKWMNKLPKNEMEDKTVEERIEAALENIFKEDSAALREALNKRHIKIVRENLRNAIKDHAQKIRKNTPMRFLTWAVQSLDNYVDQLTKTVVKDINNHHKEMGFSSSYHCSLLQKVNQSVAQIREVLKIEDEQTLEISLALYVCQYICYQFGVKTENALVSVNDQDISLYNYGIQADFEKQLYAKFHRGKVAGVINVIYARLANYGRVRNFVVSGKPGIHLQGTTYERANYVMDGWGDGINDNAKEYAQLTVDKLFEDVQEYIDRGKIQEFREEYIDEIIHKVYKMKENHPEMRFTKTFVMDLAVHLCQFQARKFSENHKKYMDEMDQRFVYKRDNYGPCFERFKNFYHRCLDEEEFSNVLLKRLGKALEKAIDNKMAGDLADEVKNNVTELKTKSTFLRAVLRELILKDDFEHFYLYLTDVVTSLEDHIALFIDRHLYSGSHGDGKSLYIKIAHQNIDQLIAELYVEVSELQKLNFNSLENLIKELQGRLKSKFEIPLEDLMNLSKGYTFHNLQNLSGHLKEKLHVLKMKLRQTYERHSPLHHRYSVCNNVYKVIDEECKGCTEKCPFCAAPCSLNTEGHIELKVEHQAIEHYPVACGRHRWENSRKLIVENCSSRVVSNIYFKNDRTAGKLHKYKKYKAIYPDWKIEGNKAIEASPYWKWFMFKYEGQLAERFGAERPDIPESWGCLTKEDALDSLKG